MSDDFLIAFYIFLCALVFILLIVFIIYILDQEKSKTRYYKQKILYSTNYDKHISMVSHQKRVLLRKKIYLYFLLLLVGIKEVVKK